MKIGIDASRAFLKNRTGIEEYSYQTTKNLRNWLGDHEVILYIRKNQEVDFELPNNWKVKKLWLPRFSSQLKFSLEFLINSPDALLVPAHTVPPIHPKKTVVVIHGLEYEFCPEAYSAWERFYMRTVIKNSCRWANKIICVSENTKKDLERLYKVSPEKMSVIYEGYTDKVNSSEDEAYSSIQNKKVKDILRGNVPYLFFVGRIEKRKNIQRITEAFELVKEKYGIPHKLVLAGGKGYGYDEISKDIRANKFSKEIFELGYISSVEKNMLLKKADVFLFPTLYEGFGIPILEAQNAMTPVIASNTSSIPEVAGDSALLLDPKDPLSLAENIYILATNEKAKEDLVKRGLENLKRFGWNECARKIAGKIIE